MATMASLGPLEKAVMDVVWAKSEISVRAVWEHIDKHHDVAYTTVLTILDRLYKKGLVSRNKIGKCYFYSPTENKQKTIQAVIRQSLHTLVDRFGDEAIAAFIDEVEVISKKNKKS